jgi:hypothetical protein
MDFPDGEYKFEVSKSEIAKYRGHAGYYILLTLSILDDGPYKYEKFKHPIFDTNPEQYRRNLDLILGNMVDQYRLLDPELMFSASALMFERRFTAKIVTERIPSPVNGERRRYLKI